MSLVLQEIYDKLIVIIGSFDILVMSSHRPTHHDGLVRLNDVIIRSVRVKIALDVEFYILL